MNIRITARHLRPSIADKTHITDRIAKFDHFDEHVNEVHVILSVEKFRHTTELIALGKHVRLSACEEASHVLEAFDMAFEKLKRQLKKHHERERADLRRRTTHRPVRR